MRWCFVQWKKFVVTDLQWQMRLFCFELKYAAFEAVYSCSWTTQISATTLRRTKTFVAVKLMCKTLFLLSSERSSVLLPRTWFKNILMIVDTVPRWIRTYFPFPLQHDRLEYWSLCCLKCVAGLGTEQHDLFTIDSCQQQEECFGCGCATIAHRNPLLRLVLLSKPWKPWYETVTMMFGASAEIRQY